MKIEHWKNIIGFLGYQVSDWGRIRSFRYRYRKSEERSGFSSMIDWSNPKIVKMSVKDHRTNVVCIGIRKNEKQYKLCVARLVLSAFVGPCPKGMECCHNDGNPMNNNLENLRWDTRKANMGDRERHGTVIRGTKMHTNRLTEKNVLYIVKSIHRGISCKELAVKFGVSATTISMIKRGLSWRWLTGIVRLEW